jgi:hypothetical protein
MWNPRIPMKEYLTVCLASGLLVFSAGAQEPAPAPGASAREAEAPKIAATSADDEAYAALMKNQLELSAQSKLLSTLAQEHRKRAEEAAKPDQAQKALWENDLVKELSDRSEALLKQLDGVAKHRLAFEQAHKNAAISVGGRNAATTAARPSPQEAEFIGKLDERLGRVTQELLTARQNANAYAEGMRTNSIPYGFERAAAAFEQNSRDIRQLEHELSELELRKLEFQALLRP